MRLPGEALPPTPRAAAPRFWWDMPPLPRMPLRAAAQAAAASSGGDGGASAGGSDAAVAGIASESEPGVEGSAGDACSSPGSADRQKLLARVRALGKWRAPVKHWAGLCGWQEPWGRQRQGRSMHPVHLAFPGAVPCKCHTKRGWVGVPGDDRC